MPNESVNERTQQPSPPTTSFSQSQSITHCNSPQLKKSFIVENGRKTHKSKSRTLNKTTAADSFDLSHFEFMRLRDSEKENKDRVIVVRRKNKEIFYDNNSNHG